MDDKEIVAIATALISKYSVYPADELPRLHPEVTCVDPENRDRIVLTSGAVVEQATGVHNAGFVLKKTRKIDVELPDDPTAKASIIGSNQKWHVKQPTLPKVMLDKVAYSGIGGNHTNTFLRMVLQTCSVNSFCSIKMEDGSYQMSLEKLRALSPAHADAAEHGCPTIVLSKRMIIEQPNGKAIISAAENLVGSCRRCNDD